MSRRPDKEVMEQLGPHGLSRVLEDVLDQPRLVRLANACGLKYAGMRVQSQARARIVTDLVDKCGEQVASRRAVYRVLQKETAGGYRQWSSLSPDDKQQRLKDENLLLANGNLGLHLFFLAKDSDEAALGKLLRLVGATRAPGAAARTSKSATPSVDEKRLLKKTTELQKKVSHVESQLAKAREAEKNAKRDLVKRKGELAESRMLVERLRRELAAAEEASRRAAGAAAADSPDEAAQKLDRAVRKLATEQRKLTHRLGKLVESTPAPSAPTAGALEPVLEALGTMTRELTTLKAQRTRELNQQSRRIDELRAELGSLRKALARPQKNIRVRGAAARVGVFVDVQNVYYGARSLKGKLDFDALLQTAVADRRLVQATAYVVESKTIDQRGFIEVLQQRGIEVRRKSLKVRADGSMKGDWDMELALDILDAASHLDVVVLVSGDGDFTSLVKRVKRMGPKVEVIAFPRHTAKSLQEAADSFQPLDRRLMIYPPRDGSSKPRGGPPSGRAKPSTPASDDKPKTAKPGAAQ